MPSDVVQSRIINVMKSVFFFMLLKENLAVVYSFVVCYPIDPYARYNNVSSINHTCTVSVQFEVVRESMLRVLSRWRVQYEFVNIILLSSGTLALLEQTIYFVIICFCAFHRDIYEI